MQTSSFSTSHDRKVGIKMIYPSAKVRLFNYMSQLLRNIVVSLYKPIYHTTQMQCSIHFRKAYLLNSNIDLVKLSSSLNLKETAEICLKK